MKVGVILPLRETSSGSAPRYEAVRDLALQAEGCGFDSIWVFDHLLVRLPDQPDNGIWESWTMLSAIGEATNRIELGTLVACTAFRNPAVLAKMAEALDEVSGGRLVLGLGAGWLRSELNAFGLPSDRLIDRFEEALQIICPLLRTGAVEFTGRFYSANACVSLPRGPRPNGPPILVGGLGPRMLRITARFADAWNTCWLGAAGNELSQRREALAAACRDEGRDPASLAVTVGVPVVYPDLGAVPPDNGGQGEVLIGDVEMVAEGLHAFSAAGVAHVMCSLKPMTPPALDRLAGALGTLPKK